MNMLTPKDISVLLLAFLIAMSAEPSSSTSPAKGVDRCEIEVWGGPDSRLKPNVIGSLPDPKLSVVGFEIVNHRPLVALSNHLVGFDKDGVADLPMHDAVKSISVNKQNDVFLQTSDGVGRIEDSGLKNDAGLSNTIHGHLYNSGNSVFLEVRARKGLLQFVARSKNGDGFLIASIQGTLRAASWNELGLATVVDNSLYIWEAGTKKIIRLLTDKGLAEAQDASLVGTRRAVVTLKSTVMLITSETMIVVMGMTAARCRFQDGILYLLDGHTGLIWAFHGLDQLGTKDGDRTQAENLLKKSIEGKKETSAAFLEAARIIGCEGAKQFLATSRKKDSARPKPD